MYSSDNMIFCQEISYVRHTHCHVPNEYKILILKIRISFHMIAIHWHINNGKVLIMEDNPYFFWVLGTDIVILTAVTIYFVREYRSRKKND